MRRLIAIILLVVLLIYSIYMAYSQPRSPNVVIVRPQQAQPETQTATPPSAQVQPLPLLAVCNAIYLKIGNTQLCGTITSLFYTTTGYQIAMKSGWISGQFIIVRPPICSVNTTGNVVNIPCDVEVLIPTRPIEPSTTVS
ncbi:hypothetical protein QIT50_gp17 [Pyrobaculum spherical virus 2]|uniref:Uncharacterized protein n=1 Tax=Pyrobaculum spherical virus 2 TaxID=2730632 RepID=A0A6M3VZB2_9VIRU|nr:hypothetical protein QIT50_gp17 [Pyrobaculum spherical virus 2]QJF12429.1 hypothetical protein PSV2_gp17 [Pyrobaculum spherical virus 2]